MSLFELYLLTRMDTLSSLSGLMGGIFALFAALATCGAIFDDISDRARKNFCKLAVGLALSTIFFLTLHVLTPNNKELAIILAGKWATNSEEMKQLPDNVVATLSKFMDSYLEGEEE